MTKPRHIESNIQIACVNWFRYQYPKYAMRLTAFPSGGNRSAQTGAILKREGLMPGYPDILLFVKSLHYGGLFIEVKTEKGRLSDSQKLIHKELENDYKIVVVRSVDEFMKEINGYLL